MAAKSEISGRMYSNSYILPNSRTNESFTFTELPRSMHRARYNPSYKFSYNLYKYNVLAPEYNYSYIKYNYSYILENGQA